jgi:hypothetical protein
MRIESNYEWRAKIMIGCRPPFRKSGEMFLLHAVETLLETRPYLLNRGKVGASGWPSQEVHERCERVLIWSKQRSIVLLEKIISLRMHSYEQEPDSPPRNGWNFQR